jgi:hypothetical protein
VNKIKKQSMTGRKLPLSRVLFFLCKGTTCASLSLSGNVDVSKDLFIILEMGLTISS